MPETWEVVARERANGEVFVAELLDDLCRRWGMDPVEVWRRPRQAEIDFSAWRARWVMGMALCSYGDGRVIVGYDGA